MREVTAFLSLQLLPQLCPILGLPPSSFLCQDTPCPPFPTVPGCLQSPLTILPPQPSPCLYCEMAPGCLWAPRDHPWCRVGDECLPGMPTDGPAFPANIPAHDPPLGVSSRPGGLGLQPDGWTPRPGPSTAAPSGGHSGWAPRQTARAHPAN